MTLAPLSKDYSTAVEVEEAFRSGEDFVIVGAAIRSQLGRLCNINRDLIKGEMIALRYDHLNKSVLVTV